MLSTFKDYFYYPWVLDIPIMWSIDNSNSSKSCQIPLKELLRAYILWSYILKITQDDTLFQTYGISWCIFWEYLLSSTLINSNLINKE